MTPEQCKSFIEDEIMTSPYFSDADRWIWVKIVNSRTEEDEWYNTVVITMDDNDLTVGRDHDGMVYYDL